MNSDDVYVLETPAAVDRELFDLPVGYHYPCWYHRDIRDGTVWFDRMVPKTLREFVQQCSDAARMYRLDRPVGTAFLRVIDAGDPDPQMNWHRDNLDHPATRFSTALSTDGVPVNLAFALNPETAGKPTSEGPRYQPLNGDIVMYETAVHGALCQPPRDGEKTLVLFSTMYRNREEADLYTTNKLRGGGSHAVLPDLESTRKAVQ